MDQKTDKQAEAENGFVGGLSKQRLVEILKYLFVGGSSSLLELALFQLQISLLGTQVGLANVIAVVLATCYNFLLNRNWTFASSANPIRSAVLYFCLWLFNTSFSTFAITRLSELGLMPLLAKILAMACIVIWNYFIYRKVIFKETR